MPKGSRGGTNNSGGITSNVPTNATRMTDAEANQLRQQQDSSYDANTTAAVKQYISNTNFDKQGHSMSQTMNFLLDNGVDLQNADLNQINKTYGLRLTSSDLSSMQFTDAYMSVATHALGKDTVLQRGAHDDMLRNAFGISDYTQYSESQLQSKLVGQAFSTTSYMSTSYDISKNPFLSSSSAVSGGREVVFNIKAGKNTNVLFGAKSQSEIVIDKGTSFRITGVRYTGQHASPRGRGYVPQIELDIETF